MLENPYAWDNIGGNVLSVNVDCNFNSLRFKAMIGLLALDSQKCTPEI